MNAFVKEVNLALAVSDPVSIATYVLWGLNWIHPFINGNGRTARALCYFVICVKSGGMLKGDTIFPELIRQNREEYVTLLSEVDEPGKSRSADLVNPHAFITRLLNEQLASA